MEVTAEKVCSYCRSNAGHEEIMMGKVAYGTRCLTCGATAQYSSRRIRQQAIEIAPGEENSPIGIISKMIAGSTGFFGSKKPKEK